MKVQTGTEGKKHQKKQDSQAGAIIGNWGGTSRKELDSQNPPQDKTKKRNKKKTTKDTQKR